MVMAARFFAIAGGRARAYSSGSASSPIWLMKDLKCWALVAPLCAVAGLHAAVDRPIEEPVDLIRIQAAAGDPGSQFNLALSYKNGEGVAKDLAMAQQWYRKAAQAGYAPAQYNLGVLFANGTDVPRDEKEAAKWLYAAAQNGVFDAQKILIEWYAAGRGVEKSPAKALAWDMIARRTLELRHGVASAAAPKPGQVRADGAAEMKDAAGNTTWVHPDGGVETVDAAGLRRITHQDGRVVSVHQDGTLETLFPNGVTESLAPDGRKTLRDGKGHVQITEPDGTRTEQGDTKDDEGRSARVVDRFDKDGKRVSHRVIRGDSTYEERADGTRVVEAKVKRDDGVEMILTEDVSAEGTASKGRLRRADNGEGPKDMEIWAIRRTLHLAGGKTVEVIEKYSSAGFYAQEEVAGTRATPKPKASPTTTKKLAPMTQTIRLADGSTKVMELRPDGTQIEIEGGKSVILPGPADNSPLAKAMKKGLAVLEPVEPEMRKIVKRPDGSTMIVLVKPDGSEVTIGTEPPTVQSMTVGARPSREDPKAFLPKADIAPMLRELKAIEDKARNFAGATAADHERAKAAALAYLIPLPNPPQKPTAAAGWLREKTLTKTTLHEVPMSPIPDDRSRQVPFGFHGRDAIKLHPWRHAESAHFIVHFVEEADARLTMQYIEGAFTMVTTLLNLDPQRAAAKSHVFLFPNQMEWAIFRNRLDLPATVAGFAYKTELLLPAADGKEGREESIKTLCHEVTHAIVSRFYPGRKLPLWLNEGMADYIAARTIATKRTQPVEKYLRKKSEATVDVRKLFDRIGYGSETSADRLEAFYANSEKCVRAVLEKLPSESFPKFVNALAAGNLPQPALAAAYGKKCDTVESFAALVNGAP